jgi:hypothetical protein
MTAPIWVNMETEKLLENALGANSKIMAKSPQMTHRATLKGLNSKWVAELCINIKSRAYPANPVV